MTSSAADRYSTKQRGRQGNLCAVKSPSKFAQNDSGARPEQAVMEGVDKEVSPLVAQNIYTVPKERERERERERDIIF